MLVSPEPPLLLDIYLSLLLVFRLLLDVKCFALVKFFTIETTHHPIQSTYYPNLVPSKVRTFLSRPRTILSKVRTIQTAYHPNYVPSKPRTIQTAYPTIQTSYHFIQSAYYPNRVPSKPRTIISKTCTFQT